MFADFQTSRIDANGCAIQLRHGSSGPPLLLLHGYPQTHVEWHKVAPLLAEHFTVICPDLRGYGDSDKPASSDADMSTYCKRSTANDQVAVMRALGFESFHLVGHDRGVRVGLRLALDHPDAVLSFTNLDVIPSQQAFAHMDADLAYSWFHWQLMRQPAPFPETLIGANPKFYLDFLLDNWTSVPGAITTDAYAEYLRCFCDPQVIRATCADYRAIALDLEHDEVDRGKKLQCPVLVLWGAVMPNRPGWQTGGSLDMMTVWQARADQVTGQAMNCGHFIPEERPAELVEALLKFLL
jgi:haloacetate dehalogenase